MGNNIKRVAKDIPKSVLYFSALGTTFGVSILIKDIYGGKKYVNKPKKILGTTAIVTGANCGIGKQTTKLLAEMGAEVIMACRDMEECEKHKQEILKYSYTSRVHCREINLSSCESIRKFVKQIKQEHKKVDVLINNAAVMCTPQFLTDEGFEWQLGINFFGPFLLTNLLLDLLKKSDNGRIINLVCPMFKKGEIRFEDLNSEESYHAKDAYAQSKLALVLFTQELARRLEGTNVTVNSVHPGISKTGIARHMIGGKWSISRVILSPFFWLFCRSPFQAAQTPLYLAVDPEVAEISGQYFHDLAVQELPDKCKDEEVAKRLWLVAEKWTRLNEESEPT